MALTSQEIIAQVIFRIVSVITAALILLVGIVIVTGLLIPAYAPANYRIILGVVMILYGSYRILMVWRKQRHAQRH